MKTYFRALSLAALLALSGAAAAPVSQAAPVPVLRSGIIDTKIKIAVRNYADALGLSRGALTYVYDSETDFRVNQGTALIEYGYYDSVADAVYIGGVDYTY